MVDIYPVKYNDMFVNVYHFTDADYIKLYKDFFDSEPFEPENKNTTYGPPLQPKLYRVLDSLNHKPLPSEVDFFDDVQMLGYRKYGRGNGMIIYLSLVPKDLKYHNIEHYEKLIRYITDKVTCKDIIAVLKQSSSSNHNIDLDFVIITNTIRQIDYRGIFTYVIENDLKSKNKLNFRASINFHLPYEMGHDSYLKQSLKDAKEQYIKDFDI